MNTLVLVLAVVLPACLADPPRSRSGYFIPQPVSHVASRAQPASEFGLRSASSPPLDFSPRPVPEFALLSTPDPDPEPAPRLSVRHALPPAYVSPALRLTPPQSVPHLATLPSPQPTYTALRQTRRRTNFSPRPVIPSSFDPPEPAVANPKPSISRTKPSISRTKPSISRTKPSISRTKPSISRTKPSISRTKPSISRTKPTIIRRRLIISRPKPADYSPKSTYSDPEAAYSDPTSAFAHSTSAYSDPETPYSDPETAYSDPETAHSDPKPAYFDPKPGYSDPKPTFSNSKPTYSSPNEVVPILVDDRVQPEAGSYSFRTETSDGVRRQESGRTVAGQEGPVSAVSGSYSYVLPDGQVFELSYVADENGFQPQSPYLPVLPAFPHPIPVHALEQIQRGRRLHEARARGDLLRRESSQSYTPSTGHNLPSYTNTPKEP